MSGIIVLRMRYWDGEVEVVVEGIDGVDGEAVVVEEEGIILMTIAEQRDGAEMMGMENGKEKLVCTI